MINASTYFVVSTRIWTGSWGPISWALLTFSRYALPRPRSHATGRSPHSADPFGQNGWFTISSFFGHETGAAPVSMFLTDPDVTADAQTSGLVRLLLQPHKTIMRPQLLSSILLGVHIVGFELGNRSLCPHQHPDTPQYGSVREMVSSFPFLRFCQQVVVPQARHYIEMLENTHRWLGGPRSNR